MSRIALAVSCFFQILFKGRLPSRAVTLLPEAPPSPRPDSPAATPPAAASDAAALRTEGALALLALLQREGRLVDFLRESLDLHDDAAIGAAVRDIHRGCKK